MNTKQTNNISTLTAWLVGLVALGAFVLSYSALSDVAASNGWIGWRAYVWPLLIDFALVVFSLALVRASLSGQRTWWPWALVGLFTGATVAFNLAHAKEASFMAQAVAVVPPAALFLSFETLMSMVRDSARREQATASVKALEDQLADKRQELDRQIAEWQRQIDDKVRERDGIQGDIDAAVRQMERDYDGIYQALERKRQDMVDDIARLLRDKKAAAKAGTTTDTTEVRQSAKEARQRQVWRMAEEDMTQADIAKALSVSARTIQRDLAELAEGGNGNGNH